MWEHLALTRARVIVAPEQMSARLEDIIARALAARVGSDEVSVEAREMRARLASANAAERDRTWALKLGAGGLMDIEFLAQTGALYCGQRTRQPVPHTLAALAEQEWLSDEEATTLSDAFTLYSILQQIERVALETPIEPDTAGDELRAVLATAAGYDDFDALEAALIGARQRAAQICDRLLPVTE